jgi:hypothetical protein
MNGILVNVLMIFLFAFAECFLLWVLWNFHKTSRRRR